MSNVDPMKKSSIYSIFGKYYGEKLYKLLYDCCSGSPGSFCYEVASCLGISLQGDANKVLNQQGEWVMVEALPSSPLNSIQYNNAGVFFGDSTFTRDASTKDTEINITETTITYGLSVNHDFLSLGLLSGSLNYYYDTNTSRLGISGVGDNTAAGGGPGNGFLETRDLNTGDYAVHNTEYNSGSGEYSSFSTAVNGNAVSNVILEGSQTIINYTPDGVTTYAMILNNLGAKLENIPTYADDAAALGGGLTTGHLYKTTTGGSTFLKIVP